MNLSHDDDAAAEHDPTEPTHPDGQTPARSSGCFARGAGLLVALAGLGMLGLWLTVDDWRRDLTSNEAATNPLAEHPAERPITTPHTTQFAADAVIRAAALLPRWRLVDQQVGRDGGTIRFVHSSNWLRTEQDVTVRLSRHDLGAQIEVESRSRRGWADLGQNPRNIRQLLDATRGELRADSSSPLRVDD